MKNGEWYWAGYPESENYMGPYETRDEAFKAGQIALERDPVVGYGVYPEPEEFIENIVDVDGILCDMDERAVDNEWFADDILFDIKKGDVKEAEKELQTMLRIWAKKWVYAAQCTIFPEGTNV